MQLCERTICRVAAENASLHSELCITSQDAELGELFTASPWEMGPLWRVVQHMIYKDAEKEVNS